MTDNQKSHGNEHIYDALIIGAGVCGIYMLHKLLSMGMNAKVIEGASQPGGTWNMNRYPGARFDSESYTYAYSFSEEIMQEWSWSEHFAGQPETLRYLNFVIDKLGIRSQMQFNSHVNAFRYQESEQTWLITLDNGQEMQCRFLITAIGLLSAPTEPRYQGMKNFKGESFHTYYWPEGLDIKNKRVAVIGTGATGVQVIQSIAPDVKELKVFQRRPNWCAPLHNSKIEDQESLKKSYPDILKRVNSTPGGFIHSIRRTLSTEVSDEERYRYWEELYNSPGFGVWLSNYLDVLVDKKANAEFSAFIAKKIRERVKDKTLAEKLIPKDHGFGTRRVPLETKYYEAYNYEHVDLVDINEEEIQEITEKGIRTTKQEYEFDIIVYATGFDAITGAFDRIRIEGKNGELLKDRWKMGPLTYIGLQSAGYPNLFTLAGPQSASVASNFPPAIQSIVDWCTELFEYMKEKGYSVCEPTLEAEQEWQEEVRLGYQLTLLGSETSWFTGHNSNVDGHNFTRHLVYFNSAPKFREKLKNIAEDNYRGFSFQ